MAPKLHHPAAMRIRNRYHLARADKKVWGQVKSLVVSDDPQQIAQAEELARAHVTRTPHAHALHRGSREARARKIAFLRVQQAGEREVRAALHDLGDRLAGVLTRAAGKDGKISPGRHRALLEAVKERNAEAYAQVNRIFLRQLRGAAKMGLLAAMSVGAAIVDHLKKSRSKTAEDFNGNSNIRESSRAFAEASLLIGREGKGREVGKERRTDSLEPGEPASKPPLRLALWEAEDDNGDDQDGGPDPVRQKVEYGVRSAVFEKIFRGALKQTMEAGLFGATGVSSRVWDLRDQNLLVLKRLVAAGIADGRAAGEIASDIQDMLIQGKPFDYSYTGPGIYRSAYKNALRLTRTETNRAFGSAQALFAAEKDWNVMWHVSDGQREEDECDDLDGEEMTPEEYLDQYPQHPNCLCYSTLIVPDVPEDAPESDDEPAPDEGDSGD